MHKLDEVLLHWGVKGMKWDEKKKKAEDALANAVNKYKLSPKDAAKLKARVEAKKKEIAKGAKNKLGVTKKEAQSRRQQTQINKLDKHDPTVKKREVIRKYNKKNELVSKVDKDLGDVYVRNGKKYDFTRVDNSPDTLSKKVNQTLKDLGLKKENKAEKLAEAIGLKKKTRADKIADGVNKKIKTLSKKLDKAITTPSEKKAAAKQLAKTNAIQKAAQNRVANAQRNKENPPKAKNYNKDLEQKKIKEANIRLQTKKLRLKGERFNLELMDRDSKASYVYQRMYKKHLKKHNNNRLEALRATKKELDKMKKVYGIKEEKLSSKKRSSKLRKWRTERNKKAYGITK